MHLKKALFIGRFQPFHLGHLSVIKEIDADDSVDQIIIGVGSAQYGGTDENPYSYNQRRAMIETVLPQEIKKSFAIFAIPDIHDNSLWVEHVKTIVGDFDIVYTGNELVKRLFMEKEILVKPVKITINITATKIREMMKVDDEKWKKFVPANIVSFLCKN